MKKAPASLTVFFGPGEVNLQSADASVVGVHWEVVINNWCEGSQMDVLLNDSFLVDHLCRSWRERNLSGQVVYLRPPE